jgi:alpha-tubulin suppressor-like RCC1 family protein
MRWMLVPTLFLALGTTGHAATPQIGGGEGFTCALGKSGRAFCWGSTTSRQMGTLLGPRNPLASPLARPKEVAGGFATISAGESHTCGLQADGAAFCWGTNGAGQLGFGTMSDSMGLPVPAGSGLKFSAISVGS